MEWKDIVTVLAGGLVILALAFIVKPALFGNLIGPDSPGPAAASPVYIAPASVPAETPFPDDGPIYTRSFRWTAIDGGVQTTGIRVPEALFLVHRGTPRFSDYNSWGRYALADADRPVLADLAHRIAPPSASPDEGYFRLMNLIFFVQQIPYDTDDNATSYTEGTLPRYAMYMKDGVEYPKYPVEMLIDGRGDCEDAAILMAGLLDALGYDTVLLRYSDHMALGIRMDEFNPYYAKYTPRYFKHGGKHYYYIEGTDFDWDNVLAGSTAIRGRPLAIGNVAGTGIPSVQTETPQIVALRYIPGPGEYRISPARLPAGGA